MTSPTGTRKRSDWRWFVAWVLVGAGYAFAVLGALSIGLFVLPLALLATGVLTRHPNALRGIPGLVAGLGVAPLFVAYLNRDGPGDICSNTATSSSCTQEWSPWPWLIAGSVLIALGVAWFIARRRAAAGPRAATNPKP